MRWLTFPLSVLCALSATAAVASDTATGKLKKLTISTNETRTSVKVSEQYFTGNVRLDQLFTNAEAPSKVTGGAVTFEPRVRTAWHTHSSGQGLIVTQDTGWVQGMARKKRLTLVA
ncbi:hypothetical protein [Citrobacter freundii]|uniref:hypothetical protein n=1 Tax=Citrobacter freundii TaxID=546 RepID=UPI0026B813B3